jgi:hypothetical protein
MGAGGCWWRLRTVARGLGTLDENDWTKRSADDEICFDAASARALLD